MDKTLAILGGKPVREKPFSRVRNIGEEEKRAVAEVLESDLLSGFAGSWSDRFYGGPTVQKLERTWESAFGVKYAVSMNSATSCLQAAIAAAGVGPGDEVIVSPYSMISSATCPFVTQAIPVFADIDERTFCISAETIKRCLTPRTKAVVVVQIFGNTGEMDAIMALAEEHNLVIIEDAAQAPFGEYKGKKTGTIGHMGVYSLNVHKTISSGEGGMAVTNSDYYAERLQLFRNHGDCVVEKKGTKDLVNMLGYNMRMCELEAAIAIEQLKKLEQLTVPRIEAANFFNQHLKTYEELTIPYKLDDVRHVYYNYALKVDVKKLGVKRETLVRALIAEGIPFICGYVQPIYLEPIFQTKIVFGDKGCPYTCKLYEGVDRHYSAGLCPTVERIESEELIYTNLCRAGVTQEDWRDVVNAFDKIFSQKKKLQDICDGKDFCCGKQRCGRSTEMKGAAAKERSIHEMQETKK